MPPPLRSSALDLQLYIPGTAHIPGADGEEGTNFDCVVKDTAVAEAMTGIPNMVNAFNGSPALVLNTVRAGAVFNGNMRFDIEQRLVLEFTT
jgi:hypothetical protein